MSEESQILVVPSGGKQTVVPQLASLVQQVVYLDFDGELTSYHNQDLDLHLENVEVEDSRLSAERIIAIVTALNEEFAAKNVVFVTDRPTDTEYSTIYVGKTSSFEEYGNFAGLAETVDIGNKIKNDNAFVILDATDDDSAIIETISHEARHLIGMLEHEGEGIGRYAEAEYIYYYYLNNQTLTGIVDSPQTLANYSSARTIFSSSYNSDGETKYVCVAKRYNSAYSVRIKDTLTVNGDCSVTDCIIESNGSVFNNGKITNISVFGLIDTSNGIIEDVTIYNGGRLSLTSLWRSDPSAINITIKPGGSIYNFHNDFIQMGENDAYIESIDYFVISGVANNLNFSGKVSGGTYVIFSNTIVNSGGRFSPFYSQDTIIKSGGIMELWDYSSAYAYAKNVIIENNGALWIDTRGYITAENITIQKGGVIQNIQHEGDTPAFIENYRRVHYETIGLPIFSGEIRDLNISFGSTNARACFIDCNANNITLNNGKLHISEGCISNSLINAEGSFVIESGGTAKEINFDQGMLILESGGYVESISGTDVHLSYACYNNPISNLQLNGGIIYGTGNGRVHGEPLLRFDAEEQTFIESIDCTGRGSFTLMGEISGMIVHPEISYGYPSTYNILFQSASINELQIFDGGVCVLDSDSEAHNIKLKYLISGTTSKNNEIITWIGKQKTTALLDVYGVIYDGIISGGHICVSSGGEAYSTIINDNGRYIIDSDGIAFDTYIEANTSFYSIWNNTVQLVNAGLFIRNGGKALNTNIYKGLMTVSSGGTATTAIVNNDGTLIIRAGGILEGRIHLKGGKLMTSGQINVADAEIVFDLTELLPEDTDIMVNNLADIFGATTYCISVSSSQQSGEYHLADGAYSFQEDISISMDGHPITVKFVYDEETGKYNSLTLGANTYTLSKDSNNLVLTVNTGTNVSLYDDGKLTSAAMSMSGVVLTKDGDNLMVVANGGTAIDTTVNSDTHMVVSGGGIARKATIHSGGILEVYTGSILEDTIIVGGELITAGEATANNAEIVFDLTQRHPSNKDMIVDNLLNLTGVSCSIKVSADQQEGEYLLAKNVLAFNKDVSISIDGTSLIGTFVYDSENILDNTLQLGQKTYSLTKTVEDDINELLLTVTEGLNVRLYKGNELTSTAHSMSNVILIQGGDDLMVVSSGGTATNTILYADTRMEVLRDGIAQDVIVNSNAVLNADWEGNLKGEIVLKGGKLITGQIYSTTDAKIVFDLTERSPTDNDIMVDNLANLPDASFTISVSSTDVKEGKYLLAGGADGFQSDITFSVDGVGRIEEYARQYTFVWDDERKKYTGINYNGYNYTLSVENDKLALDVTKNRQTLIFYMSINADPNKNKDYEFWNNSMAAALKAILSTDITCNDINLYVVYDENEFVDNTNHTFAKNAIYHIVGSAKATEETFSGDKNEGSDIKDIIKKATEQHKASEDNALITFVHGGALTLDEFSSKELAKAIKDAIKADTIKESEAKFSTVLFAPVTCLMANFETMWILKEAGVENLVGSENPLISYPELIKDSYSSFMKKYFQASSLKSAPFSELAQYVYESISLKATFDKTQNKYFDNYSKSKFQLSNTDGLMSALNNLAEDILNNLPVWDIDQIVVAALQGFTTTSGYSVGYYSTEDLVDFLECLSRILTQSKLPQDKQNGIKNKIDKAILAAKDLRSNFERTQDEPFINMAKRYHGISVFVPIKSMVINQRMLDAYPFCNFRENTVFNSWGELVHRIYDASGNLFKYILKYFQSMKNRMEFTEITLAQAEDAETGVAERYARYLAEHASTFSSALYEQEAILSKYDAKAYSFSLTEDEAQCSQIRICAGDDNAELKVTLYKKDGNQMADEEVYDILHEQSGAQIVIDMEEFGSGEYAYIVESQKPILFDIEYISSKMLPDSFEGDIGNDSLENAASLFVATNKGLSTNNADPDFFFASTTYHEKGMLSVWGKELSEDSLEIYLIDPETGERTDFIWNEDEKCYFIKFYGEAYFSVTGKSNDAIHYNISISSLASNTTSQQQTVAWKSSEDDIFTILLSQDDFQNALAKVTTASQVTFMNLPSGEYAYRILAFQGEEILGEGTLTISDNVFVEYLKASEDDGVDMFFTKVSGVWDAFYNAKHVGVGVWDGTGEKVVLSGKNKIEDVFAGSDDASILLLTDDENGDALFIDDIYSAFPEGLDAQARIAKIDEIRAGDGDDIVDLTSQRFDYVGGGMTVKGGLGDDVIWANKGNNTLFGDAGNDRIVGASGNDVIVGGSGDDSLHGGGGEDIFAFGGDWGNDSVEQLADGKVTLWFDEGSMDNWDESTLTYRDGDNSVKVNGVALENITLKFGDDGSQQYNKLLEIGAFDEFGNERIFENKNRGMLA